MISLPILVTCATILLRQEIWFNGVGLGLFMASITLHGIYPLDNYLEGKTKNLPKTAIIMIFSSLFIIPLLIALIQIFWLTPNATFYEIVFSAGEISFCVFIMLIGYLLTEVTEYIGRNPITERIENFGDLFFFGGPIFIIGHVWSLFFPSLILCIGIDSIHKIAHFETSSENISWICYFLFPITVTLFYNLEELIVLTLLAIPTFGYYAYLRPYYTKWLAVHSFSFAIVIVVGLMLQLIGIPCPLWFKAVPVVPFNFG